MGSIRKQMLAITMRSLDRFPYFACLRGHTRSFLDVSRKIPRFQALPQLSRQKFQHFKLIASNLPYPDAWLLASVS